MEELLEKLRLPEPQRTWIVELLTDLVRQRDECKARNLVQFQTDMGPCDFIPKAQADEAITTLEAKLAQREAEVGRWIAAVERFAFDRDYLLEPFATPEWAVLIGLYEAALTPTANEEPNDG